MYPTIWEARAPRYPPIAVKALDRERRLRYGPSRLQVEKLSPVMPIYRFVFCVVVAVCVVGPPAADAQNQPWNNTGGVPGGPAPSTGAAPSRDLSGIWDPGGRGIGAS